MEQKGGNGVVLIRVKVKGVNSNNCYGRPREYKDTN